MHQLQQLLHRTDRQIIPNNLQRTHHSRYQITHHKRQPHQPKNQKLNTLQQYEKYRHTKTHPHEILKTHLHSRTHTLFDCTLHYTNTPPMKQMKPEDARTSLAP